MYYLHVHIVHILAQNLKIFKAESIMLMKSGLLTKIQGFIYPHAKRRASFTQKTAKTSDLKHASTKFGMKR